MHSEAHLMKQGYDDGNMCMQVNANETSYQDVKNIMTNSIEEFFHKIEVMKGANI